MNTTIGTIKNNSEMHTLTRLFLFFILIFSVSCKSQSQQEETAVEVRSDVQVTSPVQKNIDIQEEFSGSTKYLQSFEIRAPFTGIVTKVNVAIADRVTEKQPLFEMKPREIVLLESSAIETGLKPGAAEPILSVASGIVSQLNAQPGSYVQEGDLLATCINRQSMRVLLFVSVEKRTGSLTGHTCQVIFPDGESIAGTIGFPFPAASETDQTTTFPVTLSQPLSVAENTHVKVTIKTGQLKNSLMVPLKAVYGNEEQSEFWVMKVVNNSLAVKTAVRKGVVSDSLVQIIQPELSVTDQIVSSGGYGLADSALIHITNR